MAPLSAMGIAVQTANMEQILATALALGEMSGDSHPRYLPECSGRCDQLELVPRCALGVVFSDIVADSLLAGTRCPGGALALAPWVGRC